MFARFVHTLTLLAFTAHAAFGCCGHHEHGHHENNCSQLGTACDSIDLVAGCGSRHCCSHNVDANDSLSPGKIAPRADTHPVCNSIAEDDIAEDDIAEDDIAEDDIAEDDKGQPCKPSPSCNEARFAFVVSTGKPTDLTCDTGLMIGMTSGRNATDATAAMLNTFQSLLARSSGFETSPVRCSRLQSWQI